MHHGNLVSERSLILGRKQRGENLWRAVQSAINNLLGMGEGILWKSAALTRAGTATPFLAGVEPLESRVLFSTLYVDPSATTSPYNGSSWSHAYQTLTAALAFFKSANTTIPHSDDFHGEFQWVQIIHNFTWIDTNTDGTQQHLPWDSSEDALDNEIPYHWSGDSRGDAVDFPHLPPMIGTVQTATLSMSFTMYLTYQPTQADNETAQTQSIPIPLYKVNWNFSITVQQGRDANGQPNGIWTITDQSISPNAEVRGGLNNLTGTEITTIDAFPMWKQVFDNNRFGYSYLTAGI
jgi:hypothetical protein